MICGRAKATTSQHDPSNVTNGVVRGQLLRRGIVGEHEVCAAFADVAGWRGDAEEVNGGGGASGVNQPEHEGQNNY